jgi:hypothetical protein
MKLVTFLQDHLGYIKGRSQYFSEEEAERLIQSGLVKDAYRKDFLDRVGLTQMKPEPKEDKAMEKPKKDKMVRSPIRKK